MAVSVTFFGAAHLGTELKCQEVQMLLTDSVRLG